MERDHVCTLVGAAYASDGLRQQVATPTRREVFCSVGNVSSSEFFAAGAHGLKPKLRLRLFAGDYDGEQIVEVDGIPYGVYRTYLGENEQLELYLEKKAGV